jgi:hypothetical protein
MAAAPELSGRPVRVSQRTLEGSELWGGRPAAGLA